MKSLQHLPSRAKRSMHKALGFGLGLPLAAFATQAHANTGNAVSLTSIAQNQDATAGALFYMIGNYAMVGGIGLAMIGLMQMAFAHKKQESMKPGAIMLIVGGVLASIMAVLHSGSATVFGNDSSSLGSIGQQTIN